MDKYGEYKIRKGQKIQIMNARGTKKLGTGIYMGKEKVKGYGDLEIPKFKLKRKIIYGYECWWIPDKVAKELERNGKIL